MIKYEPRLNDKESLIEGTCYLLWRRFESLGLTTDFLSFNNPKLNKFNPNDIDAIKFGNLISIDKSLMNDEQRELYGKFRFQFIGYPFVQRDFWGSLCGHNYYDAKEISNLIIQREDYGKTLELMEGTLFFRGYKSIQELLESDYKPHEGPLTADVPIELPENKAIDMLGFLLSNVQKGLNFVDELLIKNLE